MTRSLQSALATMLGATLLTASFAVSADATLGFTDPRPGQSDYALGSHTGPAIEDPDESAPIEHGWNPATTVLIAGQPVDQGGCGH